MGSEHGKAPSLAHLHQAEPSQLLSQLMSSFTAVNPSQSSENHMTSSGYDTSYRSAESNEFLANRILGGGFGSLGQMEGLIQTENDEEGDDEADDDDQDVVDVDAYTLKVRGEIVDFFADAAGRLNELIDERDAHPNLTAQEEQEIDAKVETRVEENKVAFETSIKPKVVEYLALIQESIRHLQAEEEELLKYCSNMYQSTCE